MKQCFLKLLFCLGIIVYAGDDVVGQQKRTKDEYVSAIKKFYSIVQSARSLSPEEAADLFGSYALEMEEYLFLKDCMRMRSEADCNQRFRKVIYGSERHPSLFYGEVLAMKNEFTGQLNERELTIAIDRKLILTDDECPGCALLQLDLGKGVVIYFQINSYADEPATIGNIYLRDGASFYNNIYPEEKSHLSRIGTVSDEDGFSYIRSGPGTEHRIVGKVKEEELFYYKPNSTSEWWIVQKLDTPSITGYVYHNRIVPRRR